MRTKKIRIIISQEVSGERICIHADIPECRFGGILDELYAIIQVLKENAKTRRLQTEDATMWLFYAVSLFECLKCDGLALHEGLYNKIRKFREPNLPANSGAEAIILGDYVGSPTNTWCRAYNVNMDDKTIYMHGIVKGHYTNNTPKYLGDLKIWNYPHAFYNNSFFQIPFTDLEELAEDIDKGVGRGKKYIWKDEDNPNYGYFLCT